MSGFLLLLGDWILPLHNTKLVLRNHWIEYSLTSFVIEINKDGVFVQWFKILYWMSVVHPIRILVVQPFIDKCYAVEKLFNRLWTRLIGFTCMKIQNN